MLDALIRYSLRHRMLILALTAFVVVYGGIALKKLPVDVFPDLNRPTVNILTAVEGMAPEEIETVVTRPIEAVLNGTPGVTKIYSSSVTGLAVVRAEFDWGTDLRFARLAISERLSLARDRMPEGVEPVLSPTSSIMGEILMIGLTSKTGATSAGDLRTAADWTIRPRLLTIPGISQAIVIGGDRLQIQVLVDADKLRRRQISIQALREKLGHLSEASGGGFIQTKEREWLIRNYGRIMNYDEIPNTAIGMNLGVPVLLKDVAEVKFEPAPKRGDASVSGKPGVIIMLQKQPGTDTLKLTEQVEKAVGEMRATLPDDLEIKTDLFKQAEFIEAAVWNVTEALRDGTFMVAIVLILFLLNFRTTVITLTAIPLSLLITAIVFHLFGIGVNTMTLGGLAIAIGELVDDAIVDVENVFRRLRENRLAGSPKSTLRVVYEASSEVRNSIVLATIIVVLVFIPLFALSGIEGRLFVPIGIAYVISLLASLLVSLTVTPVLCSYLLKKGAKDGGHEEDGKLVRLLKKWDRSLLEKTLENPTKIIYGALALIAISLLTIPFMGRNFLPPFNEGSAMMEVASKGGISLEGSNEIALKVEKALLEVPEVKSTGRRTGRAEEDDHGGGVNLTEIEIALKRSDRTRAEVFEDLRKRAQAVVPETTFIGVTQPITHRVDYILSGVKSQVAVKLFGPDLRILRQQSAEIRNAMNGIPGIVDLRVEGQVLFPQYKIYAMRPDLAKYGIPAGELMDNLEAMLQGVPVTRIIEKDRYLDVYLRLNEESRKDIDAIKKIPAHVLPSGQVIELGDVTDIFETSGPNQIERENLMRRIVISFNTSGRDLESVVNDAAKAIQAKVKLPEGYFLQFGGQYESQKEATRLVTLLGILSIAGIFLILFIHFRSSMIAAQIMVNIPLALVGSVIAIFMTDRTFSVATLIAFITLCGIASRNGIMMIDHYLHLMKHEGQKFSKEMIIRGSLDRLIPVLMTAFSAILALSPLLFAQDQPGKEILHPVAVVIVGGLLSSTLLDIFVTPAIFYRYGKKAAEKLTSHTPEDDELSDSLIHPQEKK